MPGTAPRWIRRWAIATTIILASPAMAQLLGGGGGRIGNAVGGLTSGLAGGLTGQGVGNGPLTRAIVTPLDNLGGMLSSTAPGDLLSLRRERLRALVQDNRRVLDADDAGAPIRRDEIVGLGLTPEALAKAKSAGFTLARTETVDNFGLTLSVLAPPKGKAARKAIEALRRLDPAGSYTLDYVYEPARAPLAPIAGPAVGGGDAGAGVAIGLIDGGIGNHPAFANAHIEQRGFAGDPKPSGHGTAVASLMVGDVGAFHGVLPGASLLAADVYGGSASNGSAVAIVRAMGWLAERRVRVVNISLVGPPNPLLEAGIKALQAKGILVVAAVGNDGPAAPPQYPASYPGVIAVTGVDAKGQALIEAGKPLHLDFAAPGADMVGAVPGGGWERVRGTSFAAPLVTASLARLGSVDRLAATARPGRGRIGRGIVCGDCGTAPQKVGAK
ncbi:S8 family serine peptidase [Sphingomonas sp. MMS24-J13]|uniref:S8 family serine peptidase n=1 Tax=Sphingomonas sp. MMS24-J13 TaxID=3238686 RepID=UPI00384DA023